MSLLHGGVLILSTGRNCSEPEIFPFVVARERVSPDLSIPDIIHNIATVDDICFDRTPLGVDLDPFVSRSEALSDQKSV